MLLTVSISRPISSGGPSYTIRELRSVPVWIPLAASMTLPIGLIDFRARNRPNVNAAISVAKEPTSRMFFSRASSVTCSPV
ncbi:hypothetical protein D3C81_1984800 [compost metagenome]